MCAQILQLLFQPLSSFFAACLLPRSHNSWVSGGSDFTLKTSFCPHLVSSRPSLKSAFKVYEGTHTSFQVSPITTPAGHQLGFGGNSLKVRTLQHSTNDMPDNLKTATRKQLAFSVCGQETVGSNKKKEPVQGNRATNSFDESSPVSRESNRHNGAMPAHAIFNSSPLNDFVYLCITVSPNPIYWF